MASLLEDWDRHYEPLKSQIREGNEPFVWQQQKRTQNAVVLLHGLTDSPHFVRAIGARFFEKGFTVLAPLLPAHGKIKPGFMLDANLDDWRQEVKNAVDLAKESAKHVSIGGLSLGGALALEYSVRKPEDIGGGLFLFSAAMDLLGRKGDLAEIALRKDILVSPLSKRQDKRGKDLIGPNPYRYGRMDLDGASQLSRLIKDIDNRYSDKKRYSDIYQPVFIAHSEADPTADIRDLEKLKRNHPNPNQVDFFKIERAIKLRHASVVLEDDVLDESGNIVEPKNPKFSEMMDAMTVFIDKHLKRI